MCGIILGGISKIEMLFLSDINSVSKPVNGQVVISSSSSIFLDFLKTTAYLQEFRKNDAKHGDYYEQKLVFSTKSNSNNQLVFDTLLKNKLIYFIVHDQNNKRFFIPKMRSTRNYNTDKLKGKNGYDYEFTAKSIKPMYLC